MTFGTGVGPCSLSLASTVPARDLRPREREGRPSTFFAPNAALTGAFCTSHPVPQATP